MNEDILENISLTMSVELSKSQLWREATNGGKLELIDGALKGFFQKLTEKISRNTKGLSRRLNL
jgi:hypothetical protein